MNKRNKLTLTCSLIFLSVGILGLSNATQNSWTIFNDVLGVTVALLLLRAMLLYMLGSTTTSKYRNPNYQ